MTDVSNTFEEMNKRLTAEKAAKVNTTFLFEVGGESGSRWYADLTKTEGPWVVPVQDANDSTAAKAQCTVIVPKSDDWVGICSGKINSQMAFMQGKVKIKGDMTKALKLGSLLA